MRNLVVFAALAIAFMIGILLFVPVGGKKKVANPIEKPVIETKEEDNIFLSKKDNPLTVTKEEVSDGFKPFEVLDGPRDSASSHNMDEKFFVSFSKNDYDSMHAALQERLISLSNAKVRKEKAKRVYKDD